METKSDGGCRGRGTVGDALPPKRLVSVRRAHEAATIPHPFHGDGGVAAVTFAVGSPKGVARAGPRAVFWSSAADAARARSSVD